MSVQRILEVALDRLGGGDGGPDADAAAIDDARAWLARAEIFLDWVANHPKLVEINSEAKHLITRYRGAAG